MRRGTRQVQGSRMNEPSDSLREQFGDIDVYLFDKLLRGRIVSGMKVLDAGCGSGRNLIFLMRAGFDVWGVDESEAASAAVQHLATELAQEGASETISGRAGGVDVPRYRLDGRCNLERRAPLRARRQPLAGNGPRDVESARARRPAFRPASDHGGPASFKAARGQSLCDAGRDDALSRRP